MTYTITPQELSSITDAELAFSTDKLLPAWKDIPEEFKTGNIYTKIADAIFFGFELPDCDMEFLDGFDPESLNRAVRAHLQSFGPKHEHKIAGVGYMMSMVAKIQESTPADDKSMSVVPETQL